MSPRNFGFGGQEINSILTAKEGARKRKRNEK
jgi:hypothetical protein